ncbi:DNA endonuclease SmrA [Shewanella corallii]|uniref:DNA endonuclease SmrA n=2 Tax=Shewanella TaxID=22 RepID=A0ABT0N6L8_9GAMM|nr:MULTISPECIES: DNA endonuclease SmrA [Shewanella]MCL1038264.1 DNA endonuclease SmrA [Shewanella submarina]MCL2914096.1 DNA endonuclease SmrA [Shewanella corallii]
MTGDESELFWAEMAGVKPLEQGDKVFNPEANSVTQAQLSRRAAAEANEYLDRMPTDPALFKPMAPDDPVSFKRQGVQDQVFKNLRLGKYKHPTILDLRGMRLRDAKEALVNGMLAAFGREERCVLLIHGKGLGNKPYPALIKSAVSSWLPQLDEVMGFHSALKEEGGNGAMYVMLAKSQAQKDAARETHHKGSGFR